MKKIEVIVNQNINFYHMKVSKGEKFYAELDGNGTVHIYTKTCILHFVRGYGLTILN